MRAKWYISTLIIILAFLGTSQDQAAVPNQEMVLRFADKMVTSNGAQNAIATVKEQLQSIGIINIQVQEAKEGIVKISYYSDVDISSIKEKISSEKELLLDDVSNNQNKNHNKFPSDKESKYYNFDIYEIQNDDDSGLGLGGKYVFEGKQEYVRFYNPNVFLYVTTIDANNNGSTIKVAYAINKNSAIAIDNTSYKIPEVRAGPSC